MKYKRFWIPGGLCELVFGKKKTVQLIRQLQLFTFLKARYGSHVNKKKLDLHEIAKELSVSERTVRDSLKRLRAMNWVGFNEDNKDYYLRSWDRLRKYYALPGRRACLFHTSQIKNFSGFTFGAAIKSIEYRIFRRGPVRQSKKRRNPAGTPAFFPMANSYLAKILNTSASTISRYKAKAFKQGFIEKANEESFIPLMQGEDVLGAEHERHLIKAYPELKGMIVNLSGYLFLRQADHIRSLIPTTKRKKLHDNGKK